MSFRTLFAGRATVHHGNRLPGSRESGLLFLNPLPPFGALHVCQQPAVSWSADGAFSYTALASNPGPRPPQHARWVAWEDARPVEVDGSEVRVGGSTFAQLATPAIAREVARRLEELRELPRSRREAAIERALELACDEREAGRRLEAFARARVPVDWAAGALFVHLFAVAPALVRLVGIDRAAIPLLAVFALLLAATVAAWARADRELGGGPRRARRALGLAVAPLAAIRAIDRLSRDVVCASHPLAVSIAIARRGGPREQAETRELALAVLRDARTPREPRVPDAAPEARAAEAWFRGRLVAALERACARGLDGVPEDPPPAGEGARCPRCLAEYVGGAEGCYDCGGIALRGGARLVRAGER